MFRIVAVTVAALIFAVADYLHLLFAPAIKRYCEQRSLQLKSNQRVAKVTPVSTYRLAGWIYLACSVAFLTLALIDLLTWWGTHSIGGEPFPLARV